MERKYWVTPIVAIIILFILLFPKNCGYVGTDGTSKECGCIGFRAVFSLIRGFGGKDISCFGIPTGSCSCYELIIEGDITQNIYGNYVFGEHPQKIPASC
jgi:hypothetical protein